MRILMIGDIVGKPGRKVLKTLLPQVVSEHGVDYVIANGENSAGGKGITRDVAAELFNMGVDVITTGNHVWDNKDVYNFIDAEPRLLRPANYPGDCPGRGFNIYDGPRGWRIAVVNVSGRVFMSALDCPFITIDFVLKQIEHKADLIVVDFHAEATSEKQTFAYYVDGRVNAVLGTHTHVQTADERILERGTAYISDVGMTGPRDSILGVKREQVLNRFLTQRPVYLEVASGPNHMDAVILEISDDTLTSRSISRIHIVVE